MGNGQWAMGNGFIPAIYYLKPHSNLPTLVAIALS